MVKHYKLLKDLPDVKAGAIFEYNEGFTSSYYEHIENGRHKKYGTDTVENNPDWFAPYLFTMDCGTDLFQTDRAYIVDKGSGRMNNIQVNVRESNYLYFATKEKAEQYLESLKPKFKVGDIVICEDYCEEYDNKPLKITKIDDSDDIVYYYFEPTNNNNHNFSSGSKVRLATDIEILKFYEKQGWVKDAKFKFKNQIYVLHDITLDLRYPMIGEKVGGVCCLLSDWLDNFQVFPIEECELIKEPCYPKSWGEIKTDFHNFGMYSNPEDFLNKQNDFNFGYYIDNDFKIYPSGQRVTLADDRNVYRTFKQARSALAFAQLTQLHAATIDKFNEYHNCNWEPYWNDYFGENWIVVRILNHLEVVYANCFYRSLAFPTKELAEFSLEHWKELWEQYYELT